MLVKWRAVKPLDQRMTCDYFWFNLDHLLHLLGKHFKSVAAVVFSKEWNSKRDIQRTYHEVRSVKCDPGKLEFSGLLSSTYLICLRIRRSYGRMGTAESGEDGTAGFFLPHIMVLIPRICTWDLFSFKRTHLCFTTD